MLAVTDKAMTWCEHCRDHYPGDHYDRRGFHKVGKQHGQYGYLLKCEVVLREIADSEDREVSAHRLTVMAKAIVENDVSD